MKDIVSEVDLMEQSNYGLATPLIEHYKQMDRDIDFIIRNKIRYPIKKGNITTWRLKIRGVTDIVFCDKGQLLGIRQRGKVIGVDGEVDLIFTES